MCPIFFIYVVDSKRMNIILPPDKKIYFAIVYQNCFVYPHTRSCKVFIIEGF